MLIKLSSILHFPQLQNCIWAQHKRVLCFLLRLFKLFKLIFLIFTMNANLLQCYIENCDIVLCSIFNCSMNYASLESLLTVGKKNRWVFEKTNNTEVWQRSKMEKNKQSLCERKSIYLRQHNYIFVIRFQIHRDTTIMSSIHMNCLIETPK